MEIRAIIIDAPQGTKRIRIMVRGDRGDDYRTLEYPKGGKLNRGQVISFVGKSLGVAPGKIAWPDFLKAPGE